MKRLLKWSAPTTLALAALYGLLLFRPYPLFAYQASYGNIVVYSDRPVPPQIGGVLREAEARLAKSPLNRPEMRHPVFIANDQWRFALFANRQYRVGGLTYGILNDNVFLRAANIRNNRLIGYSGAEVSGDRTLAYFIAHEITHTLEARYLGAYGQLRLAEWRREGYADLVGRDGDFNFALQLAAYQRGDPSMDPARSGLYLRYALECWYLMNRKGVGSEDLLRGTFDEPAIQRELRALR